MCVTSAPASASSTSTPTTPATQMVLVLLIESRNLRKLAGSRMAMGPDLGEGNFWPGLRADSLITCNDQGQCDGPTQ